MLRNLVLSILFASQALGFVPESHKNFKLLPNNKCGEVNSDRIIGGHEVAMNSLPWLVSIAYEGFTPSDLQFGCGGALITRDYVLTAAHCVDESSIQSRVAVVRLGEHDTRTNPDCRNGFCADPVIDVKPEFIIVHKNYRRGPSQHDIALIKLRQKVRFTAFVKPICLPVGHVFKKDFTGSKAVVAGWGVYDTRLKSVANDVLASVTLPIIPFSACRRYLASNIQTGPGQMCGGGLENRDSCDGDSGGPFMKVESTKSGPRYFAIGLVSFGPQKCGSKNRPAVYTKVQHYMDWILSNIGGKYVNAKVRRA